MSLLENLPHRCTIALRKREKSLEGLGSSVDSFSIVSQDVSCWEQTRSEKSEVDMQKRSMDDIRKVYFTADLGLDEKYVLIMTSKNGTAIPLASQKILSVVSKAEPDASAGMGILWRVMCQYRTGAELYANQVLIN